MQILIALYVVGFVALLVRFTRLVMRWRRTAGIRKGLKRLAAERVAYQ
jgi:hypothetical protein